MPDSVWPACQVTTVLFLGWQEGEEANCPLEAMAKKWKPDILIVRQNSEADPSRKVPCLRTRFGEWVVGREMVEYFLSLQIRLKEKEEEGAN